MDPLDSIRRELEAIAASGLRRRTRVVESAQGPTISVEGRSVLNFCSNDYIGLAAHPALSRAAQSTNGFGSGASRLITGTTTSHHQLERQVADWLGTESAVLFNSGYQANVGMVSALVGPEDAVFSDSLNHASLIDGCRLSRATVKVYPHLDYDSLDASLAQTAARRKLVISESIFSMDGDAADVARLAELTRKHAALLVVDDAHAIGVYGDQGRGWVDRGQADAVVGTLGKSFGSFGAYVAGRAPIVDLLVQRARSFIFSTALPDSVSAASIASLALLRGAEGDARRSALRARIEQFRGGFRALGGAVTSSSHIQPVLVRGGEPQRAVELGEALYHEGIFALAIRPPTVPRGTSRLRVTLRADHTPEHVEALLSALARHRDLLAIR